MTDIIELSMCAEIWRQWLFNQSEQDESHHRHAMRENCQSAWMSNKTEYECAWLVTFLLPSSFLSKAHCCLHCSQVCGGPYFFSELVQRWHLVPMNAAMMLQYWHGFGWQKRKRCISASIYRISSYLNILSHELTVPNCLTFCAHFLQIVLVLLKIRKDLPLVQIWWYMF